MVSSRVPLSISMCSHSGHKRTLPLRQYLRTFRTLYSRYQTFDFQSKRLTCHQALVRVTTGAASSAGHANITDERVSSIRYSNSRSYIAQKAISPMYRRGVPDRSRRMFRANCMKYNRSRKRHNAQHRCRSRHRSDPCGNLERRVHPLLF